MAGGAGPSPPGTGAAPYRGLESFQPEDADWFFGRRELTDYLSSNYFCTASMTAR